MKKKYILKSFVVILVVLIWGNMTTFANNNSDKIISFIDPIQPNLDGSYIDENKDNSLIIPCEIGTPVYITTSGVVTAVGNDDYYGTYIIVQHDDVIKTLYANLTDVNVRVGDSVWQAEIIAKTRNLECSDKSILRFEIYLNDELIDPIKTLPHFPK